MRGSGAGHVGGEADGAELALLARARDGHHDALEQLLQRYEDRIAAQARSLAPATSRAASRRDDLYQAGCEGFCAACRRYNPEDPRANGLWAYASRWVRGAMIRELAVGMGLSGGARAVYSRVKACRDELLHHRDHEPGAGEIAGCAGATVSQVQEILAAWAGTTFTDLAARSTGEDAPGSETALPDERVGGPFSHPAQLEDITGLSELVEATFATKPRHAQKFLVLCILAAEDIKQDEWPMLLAGNHTSQTLEPLTRFWPEHCQTYHLWHAVPPTWPDVCELFASPPPPLNRGALAQFMHRSRIVLQEERRKER